MITEDYVSFKTATLLKEKGFVGECSKFYMPNGHGMWKYGHYHDFDISKRIECPTLQMAMKWLREEKKLVISIELNYSDNSYSYSIDSIIEHRIVLYGLRETYEEAIEAALKCALENLI